MFIYEKDGKLNFSFQKNQIVPQTADASIEKGSTGAKITVNGNTFPDDTGTQTRSISIVKKSDKKVDSDCETDVKNTDLSECSNGESQGVSACKTEQDTDNNLTVQKQKRRRKSTSKTQQG